MLKLKNTVPVLIVTLLLAFIACDDKYPELEDGLYAEIVTNMGTMVANLEMEKTPLTVANFVALAEGNHPMAKEEFKGKKYYNGLTFHRVMDQFMIQGGDPEGTGRGGPGFKFEDEFHPDLKHDELGVLSMANSGPNSNGSQFFILETPKPHLDNVHTVFGELVMGKDVLDSISNVKVGQGNKPETEIVMQEINIIRKGSDAKNFDAAKVFNEELPKVKERQAMLKEEQMKKAEEERQAQLKMNADKGMEKKPTLDGYKEKAKTLPSGLMVHYLEKGNGIKPKAGDKVLLDYEGYYTDGRLFDTSLMGIAEQHGMVNEMKVQRNMYQPMPMVISPDAQMIAGFKEAVASLKVGDKAYFYLPSHLAYGEQGRGEIQPNTDLIFLIHLKEIAE